MVKSATEKIISESSKLDLHSWLAGGKPRTKTVFISNNPDLAVELDELATRINALADEIDKEQEETGTIGGIADDDPVDDKTAEQKALLEQWEALDVEYQESLLSFTFRGQKPTEIEEVKVALKADNLPANNENLGLGLVAHTCIEPVMTPRELKDALEVLGTTAFLQMNDAVIELAKKRKEPTAPLSLRP